MHVATTVQTLGVVSYNGQARKVRGPDRMQQVVVLGENSDSLIAVPWCSSFSRSWPSNDGTADMRFAESKVDLNRYSALLLQVLSSIIFVCLLFGMDFRLCPIGFSVHFYFILCGRH